MRTSNISLLTALLSILLTACAQQEIVQSTDIIPNNTTLTDGSALTSNSFINIELYVLLEGPYQANTKKMNAALNGERGLLPGQSLIGVGIPTPFGQPYSADPWNFKEEDDEGLSFADYPIDIVDWVLVSFRTDITSNTEVIKTAAWLQTDGKISFLNPNSLRNLERYESVYIVIEHRNHMAAMTPEAIPISDNSLVYDFRRRDSYRVPTSYGQKQLATGEWAMLAGDSNQSDSFSYDINAYDKVQWVNDNGTFGQYNAADLDLDGDVNLLDKILWANNNGKLSAIPK